MGSKLGLIFLLLALAMAMAVQVQSSSMDGGTWVRARTLAKCDGDDCIVDDNEQLMENDASRRQLADNKRYISYGALKANAVPCGQRGNSYYNCRTGAKANPYTRGCTAITNCYRWTS